ncbi:MAG: FkbM family methyltransferase [Magnetospirillum sp.]|nr:FkbM family methyltransferase [Magnetospirillum sp.]
MKRFVLRLLAGLGYELRRHPARDALSGALANAARLGTTPATIIDVGAARGGFAAETRRLWPQARMLLVEPLAEFSPALTAFAAGVPGCTVVATAAGNLDGEVTFNVHPDLFGSSLYVEDEEADVNGDPRTVRLRRLDSLRSDYCLAGPFLLKIDVQGAERDVLEGARGVLAETAMAIIETSFLPFFRHGPLAAELMAWMEAAGFVLYDIVGLAHRPLDAALAQADLVFVPRDSPLRRDHRYATPAQRAALTRRLKAAAK